MESTTQHSAHADSASAFLAFIAMLRQRWLSATVAAVVVLALVVVATLLQPTRYSAAGEVLIRTDATNSLFPSIDSADQYLVRFTSAELAYARSDAYEDAVTAGFEDDATLDVSEKPALTTEFGARSDTLVFAASAGTAQDALRLANTAVNSYISLRDDQTRSEISDELERIDTQLTEQLNELDQLLQPLQAIDEQIAETATPTLLAQLLSTRSATADSISRERERFETEIDRLEQQQTVLLNTLTAIDRRSASALVVEVPELPEGPFSPDWVRNLALGIALALIAGVAVAIARQSTDDRIQGTEDLAELGLPLLAKIPLYQTDDRTEGQLTIHSASTPNSVVADSYRSLVTALQFVRSVDEIHSLQILSAEPSEGKTTTACNLAVAMARFDEPVTLVDADLRRPRVHRHTTDAVEPPERGLSGVLAGTYDLEHARIRPDGLSFDTVLSGSRPPNPSELLASDRFAETLGCLKESGHLTIVDSPPVLAVPDSLVVARSVDGAVLVLRVGSTKRSSALEAVQLLRGAGVNIVGAVLIGVRDKQRKKGYGYYAAAEGSPNGPGQQGYEPPAVLDVESQDHGPDTAESSSDNPDTDSEPVEIGGGESQPTEAASSSTTSHVGEGGDADEAASDRQHPRTRASSVPPPTKRTGVARTAAGQAPDQTSGADGADLADPDETLAESSPGS